MSLIASGSNPLAKADSNSGTRKAQGPAPVIATRTPSDVLATNDPTIGKRDAGFGKCRYPASSGIGKDTDKGLHIIFKLEVAIECRSTTSPSPMNRWFDGPGFFSNKNSRYQFLAVISDGKIRLGQIQQILQFHRLQVLVVIKCPIRKPKRNIKNRIYSCRHRSFYPFIGCILAHMSFCRNICPSSI